MGENLSIRKKIEEIIEKEMKNNLWIKLTSGYDGYVKAKLLYKNKVISEDSIYITTDSNPLDE